VSPIRRWKVFAEGSGILVAHPPGDLVHRQGGAFQQIARPADPQVLQVGGRPQAGGTQEPAQEGAFAQARRRRQLGDPDRFGGMLMQPMLGPEDRRVAMLEHRREDTVEALLPPAGVDQEVARGGQDRRVAEESADQEQAQVDPGHQPASGDQIAVIDDQAVGVEQHPGMARGEPGPGGPMGGGGTAGQQPGFGEQEGPCAHRAEQSAVPVPAQEPGAQAAVRIRREVFLAEAGRQDQGGQRPVQDRQAGRRIQDPHLQRWRPLGGVRLEAAGHRKQVAQT